MFNRWRGRSLDAATRPSTDAEQPQLTQARAAFQQAVPVLHVLGAQLGHVNDTTEQAAVSFLDEMQAVDGATGSVAGEAGRLAELAAEQSAGMAEITTLSRGTGQVIDQLVAFIARRDQTVIDLVAEVRGLSNHLGIIQKISRATTTLALNAKIEASRAGEHGAGFQVVADEVRDLSRQSDLAARDIGQQIQQLARRLAEAMQDQGALHDAPSDPGGPGGSRDPDAALTRRLQAVAHQQHDLVHRMEKFTGGVEAASQELVASAATMHSLTTSMMAGLQFQDITRQVIEHVVSSLDGLWEQFTLLASALAEQGDVAGLAQLEASLDKIQRGYVMEKQRLTHAQVTGTALDAGAESDGPTVELF
jgi:methyl-accepting chemotaxis protein